MKSPILRKRRKNAPFKMEHAANSISWTAALRPLLICQKIAIYTNMLKDKRHFNALLTNFKRVGASKGRLKTDVILRVGV